MKDEDEFSQVFNINDQKIELTTKAYAGFTDIRYAFKSSELISPLQVAFILFCLTKSICEEQDVPLSNITGAFEARPDKKLLH